MKILKPGQPQTRRETVGVGTCPKCECVIEVSDGELNWVCAGLKYRNEVRPITTTFTCPNRGCRGKIEVNSFSVREVPYE